MGFFVENKWGLVDLQTYIEKITDRVYHMCRR